MRFVFGFCAMLITLSLILGLGPTARLAGQEVSPATESLLTEENLPSSDPFCDSFDDGSGWLSRWVYYAATASVVSSPTHTGTGSMKFNACPSWGYRYNFAADFGTYSAWFRQGSANSPAYMMVQVQPGTNPDPTTGRDCYFLRISASNSSNPMFTFYRNKGGSGVQLGSLTPTFGLNEWIRVFIRHESANTLVVGFERDGGVVDSIVCSDTDPVTNAGRFYLYGCTDATGNFWDEVCYERLTADSNGDSANVWIDSTVVRIGPSVSTSVKMTNSGQVSAFTIPIAYDQPIQIDSVSRIGCRTANWEKFEVTKDSVNRMVLIGGTAQFGGSTPCMSAGSGPVAKIYWKLAPGTACVVTPGFDTTFVPPAGSFLAVDCSVPNQKYVPRFTPTRARYDNYVFGDVNGDLVVDISDVVRLISYIFSGGPAPLPLCAGDANGDCYVDISDAVYLIAYIFSGGLAPKPGC